MTTAKTNAETITASPHTAQGNMAEDNTGRGNKPERKPEN
jgi:hypothetical protein